MAAVERALAALPMLVAAGPGDFTRRAHDNGRIDLTQVEGLGALLAAETERQRTAALAMADGGVGRLIDGWRMRLLTLSARVEAILDFSDEDDVAELSPSFDEDHAALIDELRRAAIAPPVERLRAGVRVGIAGPPNVGKSTLLNALAGRAAALVSPVAGTTRDVIEVPVSMAGLPIILIDMAGLRETRDPIEAAGVTVAHAQIARADLILWLGDAQDAPVGNVLTVATKVDIEPRGQADIAVSALRGDHMAELVAMLVDRCEQLLPTVADTALPARHRRALSQAVHALAGAPRDDLVLLAEALRTALHALDGVAGGANTDAMLDVLFGSFCIGK